MKDIGNFRWREEKDQGQEIKQKNRKVTKEGEIYKGRKPIEFVEDGQKHEGRKRICEKGKHIVGR